MSIDARPEKVILKSLSNTVYFLCFVLIILVVCPTLPAQTTWARTYDLVDAGDIYFHEYIVRQTADGGYVAMTTVNDDSNILILRLDQQGNIIWQKLYGDPTYVWGQSIHKTSDGGFIVLMTIQEGGNKDLAVLKLDSTGNIVWQKKYGGGEDEDARDILQTSDGGYIAIAMTDSFGNGVSNNPWIIKLDPSGNIAWQKTYGIDQPQIYCIRQTSDGGYIIGGESDSDTPGYYGPWIFKLDASGNLAWQHVYSQYDGCGFSSYAIEETPDGNFLAECHSNDDGEVMYIIKLNSSGNVIWQKYYSGLYEEGVYGKSLIQTSDKGFALIGYRYDGSSTNIIVIKVNSAGTIEWRKIYGATDTEMAGSIEQTLDGGYIFAGCTNSFGAGNYAFLVVKTDSSGQIGSACSLISDTTLSENPSLSLVPYNYSYSVLNGSGTASASSFIASSTLTTVALLCSGVNCPTISLSPSALPNAASGSSYNQTITASGGKSPYSFSLSSGSLPTGLSLSSNGTISGTASEEGSFNFTINATDSEGCSGSKAYIILVNSASSPVINSVQKLGNPFRLKVIGSNFHPDAKVYIGTSQVLWTNIKFKSSNEIMLKGGTSLKTLFPKGVAVQITVVNGDGGSATYIYTR